MPTALATLAFEVFASVLAPPRCAACDTPVPRMAVFCASCASTVDAVSPADASQEATGPGSVCDVDGDGYLAMGTACGGTDCCDTDAHVHPGQTSFFTKPGACGGYDYNCDGQETPEYGATNCQWDTFSCNGDGFAAPIPGCGVFGTFTSCSIPWYDVLECTGSNAQQAQGCR